MRADRPLSTRGLLVVGVVVFTAGVFRISSAAGSAESTSFTSNPGRGHSTVIHARPPNVILARVTSEDRRPKARNAVAFAQGVLKGEAGSKLTAQQREGIAKVVARAEIEHGFPAALALAIMKQESRFDPRAKGPAGSIGLMQLQPRTGREMARRSGLAWDNEKLLLDPVLNVEFGLRYLTDLKKKFGTLEHAIAAYNMGPSKLRRRLSRGPLPRGPYLTRIYSHADAFHKKYGH